MERSQTQGTKSAKVISHLPPIATQEEYLQSLFAVAAAFGGGDSGLAPVSCAEGGGDVGAARRRMCPSMPPVPLEAAAAALTPSMPPVETSAATPPAACRAKGGLIQDIYEYS